MSNDVVNTKNSITDAGEVAPPDRCKSCRLRALDAFRNADTAEAKFIEGQRRERECFERGDVIVHEHERAKFIRTIYSGWAFRFKTLSDGRRQVLNFLLPGDIVGLQEQFSDASLHGVEALTSLSTCSFQPNTLWDMFGQHSRLAFGVTWIAAREEALIDENLLSVGRRSATERIGALYLHLYRRMRQLRLVDSQGWFECPITQTHIADALGLSLVHTQRSLRQLKKLGLYTRDNGKLRIENPRALERIAEYYEQPPRQMPLI
ncbi:MAG: Crp/Fnr family transcriptional regulator [Burkholderiales bacterium]|nr:MAG: Crp/Fnr family transcriptional regulator [Betaproteobacteria bacterium]TAG84500.1 MAG: Crp/Fnr family transcriptional regulator [Burkholderiales bacterium]